MSKKNGSLLRSIEYALEGILAALKNERNFRIELIIAAGVLYLAIFFNFSPVEMAIIALTIGFVLFAEIINTSIELTLDAYFGNTISPIVKIAKDISAAGVFISVIISVIIGILMFLPRVV